MLTLQRRSEAPTSLEVNRSLDAVSWSISLTKSLLLRQRTGLETSRPALERRLRRILAHWRHGGAEAALRVWKRVARDARRATRDACRATVLTSLRRLRDATHRRTLAADARREASLAHLRSSFARLRLGCAAQAAARRQRRRQRRWLAQPLVLPSAPMPPPPPLAMLPALAEALARWRAAASWGASKQWQWALANRFRVRAALIALTSACWTRSYMRAAAAILAERRWLLEGRAVMVALERAAAESQAEGLQLQLGQVHAQRRRVGRGWAVLDAGGTRRRERRLLSAHASLHCSARRSRQLAARLGKWAAESASQKRMAGVALAQRGRLAARAALSRWRSRWRSCLCRRGGGGGGGGAPADARLGSSLAAVGRPSAVARAAALAAASRRLRLWPAWTRLHEGAVAAYVLALRLECHLAGSRRYVLATRWWRWQRVARRWHEDAIHADRLAAVARFTPLRVLRDPHALQWAPRHVAMAAKVALAFGAWRARAAAAAHDGAFTSPRRPRSFCRLLQHPLRRPRLAHALSQWRARTCTLKLVRWHRALAVRCEGRRALGVALSVWRTVVQRVSLWRMQRELRQWRRSRGRSSAVPGSVSSSAVPGSVSSSAVPGNVSMSAVPGSVSSSAVPGSVSMSAGGCAWAMVAAPPPWEGAAAAGAAAAAVSASGAAYDADAEGACGAHRGALSSGCVLEHVRRASRLADRCHARAHTRVLLRAWHGWARAEVSARAADTRALQKQALRCWRQRVQRWRRSTRLRSLAIAICMRDGVRRWLRGVVLATARGAAARVLRASLELHAWRRQALRRAATSSRRTQLWRDAVRGALHGAWRALLTASTEACQSCSAAAAGHRRWRARLLRAFFDKATLAAAENATVHALRQRALAALMQRHSHQRTEALRRWRVLAVGNGALAAGTALEGRRARRVVIETLAQWQLAATLEGRQRQALRLALSHSLEGRMARAIRALSAAGAEATMGRRGEALYASTRKRCGFSRLLDGALAHTGRVCAARAVTVRWRRHAAREVLRALLRATVERLMQSRLRTVPAVAHWAARAKRQAMHAWQRHVRALTVLSMAVAEGARRQRRAAWPVWRERCRERAYHRSLLVRGRQAFVDHVLSTALVAMRRAAASRRWMRVGGVPSAAACAARESAAVRGRLQAAATEAAAAVWSQSGRPLGAVPSATCLFRSAEPSAEEPTDDVEEDEDEDEDEDDEGEGEGEGEGEDDDEDEGEEEEEREAAAAAEEVVAAATAMEADGDRPWRHPSVWSSTEDESVAPEAPEAETDELDTDEIELALAASAAARVSAVSGAPPALTPGRSATPPLPPPLPPAPAARATHSPLTTFPSRPPQLPTAAATSMPVLTTALRPARYPPSTAAATSATADASSRASYPPSTVAPPTADAPAAVLRPSWVARAFARAHAPPPPLPLPLRPFALTPSMAPFTPSMAPLPPTPLPAPLSAPLSASRGSFSGGGFYGEAPTRVVRSCDAAVGYTAVVYTSCEEPTRPSPRVAAATPPRAAALAPAALAPAAFTAPSARQRSSATTWLDTGRASVAPVTNDDDDAHDDAPLAELEPPATALISALDDQFVLWASAEMSAGRSSSGLEMASAEMSASVRRASRSQTSSVAAGSSFSSETDPNTDDGGAPETARLDEQFEAWAASSSADSSQCTPPAAMAVPPGATARTSAPAARSTVVPFLSEPPPPLAGRSVRRMLFYE